PRPLSLLHGAGLLPGREVVGVGRRKLVLLAEERGDSVERGLDLGFRPYQRIDVDGVDAAQQDARDDRQRNEDAVVQVLVRELPSAVLDADDVQLTIFQPTRL